MTKRRARARRRSSRGLFCRGAGTAKGKSQGTAITSDGDLLRALEHIIKEAKKDSSNLLGALQDVVANAVAGYGSCREACQGPATGQRQRRQGPQPGAVAVFCRPVGDESHGDASTVVGGKKHGGCPVQQWTLEPLVGGTIGFGMAKKWLSDGTALGAHLVVVCEQAELDALLTLARAHDLKDKVAAAVCRFAPDNDTTHCSSLPLGQRGSRSPRGLLLRSAAAGYLSLLTRAS